MKSSSEDIKRSKPRVFLDAVVVIRGVCFRGYPHKIIQYAIQRHFETLLSPLVLESARKHIAKKFPKHLVEFERLLRLLPYVMVPDPTVEEVNQNLDLVRDESDIPVALSAIHGRADILVSNDPDFTDVNETTTLLRSKIQIMKPGTFLKEVLGLSSEELDRLGS